MVAFCLEIQTENLENRWRKKLPKIVFEHSGEDTLPTSLFVCDTSGMVVLCGATSGYTGTLDLRHLWLMQKRIQGSHGGTQEEWEEFYQLIKNMIFAPMFQRSMNGMNWQLLIKNCMRKKQYGRQAGN